MADKNAPQAHPAPAAAAKPKSGIMAYLPLILIVLLAPAAALLTMRFMNRGAHSTAEKSAPPEEAPSHKATAEHPKAKAEEELPKFHPGLVAPLTRSTIGFHNRKYFGRLAIMDVNGDALGEPQADKILVNVANTRGAQLIAARLAIQGDDPPLLELLNLNRSRLMDAAVDILGNKNLTDVTKPGITNLLRSELAASFSEILGRGVIRDVQFVEFELRPR